MHGGRENSAPLSKLLAGDADFCVITKKSSWREKLDTDTFCENGLCRPFYSNLLFSFDFEFYSALSPHIGS